MTRQVHRSESCSALILHDITPRAERRQQGQASGGAAVLKYSSQKVMTSSSAHLQGTGSVGTELLGCPMMEGHPRNSKI